MDNTNQGSLEQMLLELDLFIEAYITLLGLSTLLPISFNIWHDANLMSRIDLKP
jgi:hypothetical protein